MQIIRTILWVLLLVGLGIFSWANWDPRITVYIWQGIVVDTRLPAIVIVSFLIGFLPVWLVLGAGKWQLRRRIATLEAAIRNSATTLPPAEEPAPVFVADPDTRASTVAPVTTPITAPVTTPVTAPATPPSESKPILP
jgi:hypothetical protein